jgi:hypothetical protein
MTIQVKTTNKKKNIMYIINGNATSLIQHFTKTWLGPGCGNCVRKVCTEILILLYAVWKVVFPVAFQYTCTYYSVEERHA